RELSSKRIRERAQERTSTVKRLYDKVTGLPEATGFRFPFVQSVQLPIDWLTSLAGMGTCSVNRRSARRICSARRGQATMAFARPRSPRSIHLRAETARCG